MNIVILTKKPRESFFDLKFYFSELKYFLKKYIQGKRGPQSVINSLVAGLDELGESYLEDPIISQIPKDSVLCVIRDKDALQFAIEFKNKGLAKKIIAGPNIIVTPDQEDYILFNQSIDKVIVPSDWVKIFYETFEHKGEFLKNKMHIWASGIEIPKSISDKENFGIVYRKNVPEELFHSIKKYLDDKGYEYKVLEYGNFKQDRYFSLLEKSKWMIYLQEVESQGLSLLEAWANNVPTLVWNNKEYSYPNTEYKISGNISAPYLSSDSGLYFDNENDFGDKFESLINSLDTFKAGEYTENNFSNKITSQKYLDIIK